MSLSDWRINLNRRFYNSHFLSLKNIHIFSVPRRFAWPHEQRACQFNSIDSSRQLLSNCRADHEECHQCSRFEEQKDIGQRPLTERHQTIQSDHSSIFCHERKLKLNPNDKSLKPFLLIELEARRGGRQPSSTFSSQLPCTNKHKKGKGPLS